MKGFITILLLICSNTFMTLAWYGHLKFSKSGRFSHLGLFAIILISWAIAFFEYLFQVPANRIGFKDNGGPFSLWQLKVIQEVTTLTVFVAFMFVFFRDQPFKWNHAVGFLLLIAAVYFLFKK